MRLRSSSPWPSPKTNDGGSSERSDLLTGELLDELGRTVDAKVRLGHRESERRPDQRVGLDADRTTGGRDLLDRGPSTDPVADGLGTRLDDSGTSDP